METSFFILIGILVLNTITLIILLLHIRNLNAVNQDMANAFANLLKYFEKEFEINLKTHEQMQKWNEQNLQIIVDKCEALETEDKYTHQFLSRIAQGLGLQRSNLEDV